MHVQIGTRTPEPERRTLETGLERGVDHLLGLQSEEGWWWAPLDANVTITAEYLFLTHFLDVADPARWKRIATYLLAEQGEDGGWALWHGGPSDLNATVEATLALRLAGIPPESPALRAARARALALGGVEGTRVFTRVWLALLGEYDWNDLPALPPEIALAPDRFPLGIYAFACWARQTVVPMTILFSLRPVRPVPAHARVQDLWVEGAQHRVPLRRPARLLSRETLFLGLDRILHTYDQLPIHPGRARALRQAEQWILERQEADGSWGGIQPPWVYSIMALAALGRTPDDPVIRRALEGFEGFGKEDGEGWWLQSCISPVWDTALAVNALAEAGVEKTHPAMVRAGAWLLDKQILEGGDWQVRRPDTPPGGWSFEFANRWYPDTDDTAEVLMALRRVHVEDVDRRRASIDRGFRWLVEMQSKSGGWAAFDADAEGDLVTAIPFCDFGEVTDPPSVDVTAHTLECLAAFGYDRAFSRVARGLDYLRREQTPEGAWFGRWGVNWIYGTGAVLPALVAVGVSPHDAMVRRGAAWLESVQNPDGGWGETPASYDHASPQVEGESSASQTAWALLGLIAAGRVRTNAVRRGVRWLLAMQADDGHWPEPQYTGTGFPRDFLLRYRIYGQVFPLMALGRYRAALRSG